MYSMNLVWFVCLFMISSATKAKLHELLALSIIRANLNYNEAQIFIITDSREIFCVFVFFPVC